MSVILAGDRRPPVITGCGVYGAAARDCAGLLTRLKSEAVDHIRVHENPALLEPWMAAHLGAVDDVDRLLAERGGVALAQRMARDSRPAPVGARATLLAAVEAWSAAGLLAASEDGEKTHRHALVMSGQNVANEVLLPAAAHFQLAGSLDGGRLMQLGHDSYAVSLVAQALNLRGEGLVCGAAQASGHLALVQAARMISLGEADVVLVLGAPTRLGLVEVAGYQMLGALAQANRPGSEELPYYVMDRRASGFVPLESAAAIVLESVEHAARRQAPVLARLTGWRCAMHASTQLAPDGQTESRVMREALRQAGLAPDEVGFVSAHATGTLAGDTAEVEAIESVFGGGVWVNAPKRILGHALTAAGVLETVAGILQMGEGFLHGCARMGEPLAAGLRIVPPGGVRADVHSFVNNGFGFGGFNAAVVLQSCVAECDP